MYIAQIFDKFAFENVTFHTLRTHSLVPATPAEEQSIYRHTERCHAHRTVCCGKLIERVSFDYSLITFTFTVPITLHNRYHYL